MPSDRPGVERSHEKSSTAVSLCFCLQPLPRTALILPSKGAASPGRHHNRLFALAKKTPIAEKTLPAAYLGYRSPHPCSVWQNLLAPPQTVPPLYPQMSLVSELQGMDFLRLANALATLYPKDSEEERLLDAMVLAMLMGYQKMGGFP